MTTWLLFDGEAEAAAAEARIATGMGLPRGRTLRWAEPRRIARGPHAGRWGVPAPRTETTGASGREIGGEAVPYDPAWWPSDEEEPEP